MTRHKETYRPSEDPNQLNFFKQVPDYLKYAWWTYTGPKVSKDKGIELEEAIDRLHFIFQSSKRKAKYARDRISDADVARSKRQFLKALGVTQKARTERMRQQWEHAIERLKDAGVFDMVHPNMTREEEQTVIAKLQQYDRDSQEPIRDLDSSEGFAIYPTVKSWYRDHV